MRPRSALLDAYCVVPMCALAVSAPSSATIELTRHSVVYDTLNV
jgi:hypothetical protein